MHPFGTYIIAISLVFASCEKLTHVYSFRQSGMIPTTSMRIATMTPLVAKAGDEITVTGSELGGQSTIMIGGQAVQVNGRGTTVTFTMPKMPYAGAFKVTIGRVHDQSGPVDPSAAYIISDSAGDNIPIYMAVAAEVCSPTQFRDADGVLTVGTKDCVPAANCTAPGQKGCKTTTTMVGVEASFLTAANIKAGVTVGGVAGSYAGAYSTCAVSGGQGCVTSGLYYAGAACTADASNCFLQPYDVTTQPLKAVAYNSIDQSKMLDSLTIAGATGTVVSRGSWALTEEFPGAGYYTGVTSPPVAASIVPQTTLIGVEGAAPLRPADCAANRAVGCVTTATYRSADLTNLSAGNVKNGVNIVDVTGGYPSLSYPLALDTNTVDLDDSFFNTRMTSPNNFEYFDSTGAEYIHAGSTDLAPANIASGKTIFEQHGTLTSPTPWDVRAGVPIVTPTSSGTGALKVNCRNTANLSTFDIDAGWAGTVTTTATTGTSHVITTTPAHGLTSVTAVRINYSSVPGGTNNITTYYAKNLTANTLRLYQAADLTAAVNVTSAGTNLTVHKWLDGVANIWDTIDDYNNGGTSLPQTTVSGWTADTVCGGYSSIATDSNVWLDVTTTDGTTPSSCGQSAANCSFKDKISGLSWSKLQTATSWYRAVEACEGLTFNGQTDWRLPTQKELMGAYEHGLRSTQQTNFDLSTSSGFWSATAVSSSTSFAWIVWPSGGGTVTNDKSGSISFLCVR